MYTVYYNDFFFLFKVYSPQTLYPHIALALVAIIAVFTCYKYNEMPQGSSGANPIKVVTEI